MIYIMNEQGHPYGKPSSFYLNTICEGYHFCRFDPEILLTAVANSRKEALK